MAERLSRRKFLGTVGAAVAVDAAASRVYAGPQKRNDKTRIIGIACSPRKGKTTAASLRLCLEAAAGVDPRIEVELIELAGMKIDGALAAGLPPEPGQQDDFRKLVPKLSDAQVAGIIIGTPVYFGNMTSLCKALLDRCIAFRKSNFALGNKVAGVLAVGGVRNGGQELTIQSVQAALLCQEMILVGTARPSARTGATVWNDPAREIAKDEYGIGTAKDLGRRVAEVALMIAAAKK